MNMINNNLSILKKGSQMKNEIYSDLIRGAYIGIEKERLELMQVQIEKFELPYTHFLGIDKTIYKEKRGAYLASGWSKLNYIKSTFNEDKHIHILEDDVIISPVLKKTLFKILKSIENKEWDILFTDVVFSIDTNLFELENYFSIYKKERKLALLDIGNYNTLGCSSFIINKKSKKKVYNLLRSEESFTKTSFDKQIRNLFYNGSLKAMTTFPFLTKTSIHSRESTLEKRNITWDIVAELLREHFYINSEKESTNFHDLIDYVENIEIDKRKQLLLNIMKYRHSDEFQKI